MKIFIKPNGLTVRTELKTPAAQRRAQDRYDEGHRKEKLAGINRWRLAHPEQNQAIAAAYRRRLAIRKLMALISTRKRPLNRLNYALLKTIMPAEVPAIALVRSRVEARRAVLFRQSLQWRQVSPRELGQLKLVPYGTKAGALLLDPDQRRALRRLRK